MIPKKKHSLEFGVVDVQWSDVGMTTVSTLVSKPTTTKTKEGELPKERNRKREELEEKFETDLNRNSPFKTNTI